MYNNKFHSPLHHPKQVAELFCAKKSNWSSVHFSRAKRVAVELWSLVLRYTGCTLLMPLDHALRQWDLWFQSPLLPECSASVLSWEDWPPTAKWQYQPASCSFHPAPNVWLFTKRA